MENSKLVMIPGPTPCHDRIQLAMGRKTCSFKDPDFIQDFKGLLFDLQEMWNSSGEVFVVAGSGTMAMEMAVANVLEKEDNVLVISHGFFGDRFIEICERKGYDVDSLSSEWGKIVPVNEIRDKLMEKDYKALIVTHVDTSTGVRAPIQEISKVISEFNETLFIVDGVCSTAAENENIDKMGIDILFTGSQKAFGVPPGLTILWASNKALERRNNLKEISFYYIDFHKWLPIMHDPAKYFGTPAINLIWALNESIKMIKEEGLEERFKRHEWDARALQSSLESIGLNILAEKENRATTMSNVLYPKGVEDDVFRNKLEEEGVVVASGLGHYAGKLFRLGHMGHIDNHILSSTICAIERTLKWCNYEYDYGLGIKTFTSNY